MLELEDRSKESVEFSNSIEHNEEKPFGWIEFVLFLLLFLGLWLLLLFVFAAVAVFVDLNRYDSVEIPLGNYVLLIDACILFIAIALFKKIRTFLKGSFSFEPLRKGKTYLYLIGAAIIVFAAQYLFFGIWELESLQIASLELTNFGLWNMIIIYLSVAIFTPIKEEILYRGIIFDFLQKRHNFWLGVIVSSIIFGLLHLGYPIVGTIMGIVFVILYKLTKSLVVPILFHILWNSYVAILFFIGAGY